MKLFLFLILALLNISCSQIITSVSAQTPVIYFSGEYSLDGKSMDIKFLYTKTYVKDTLIDNSDFKKFKWEKFKNFNDKHQVYYEYERLTTDEYILLDGKFKTVHKLKLKPEEQKGVLFGNDENIGYEYIDTRSYSPKPKFVPDEHSPIKYFSTADNNIFIYCENEDEKKVEISMNKGELKKALSENYFKTAAEILLRKDSVEADYDVQPGDEIQIIYATEQVSFKSEGTLGDKSSIKGEQKKLPSKKEITTIKCTDIKNEGKKKFITLDITKVSSKTNKNENSTSNVQIEENGDVLMENQVIGKKQKYKLDFKIDSFDISRIPEEYGQSNMTKNFITFTGITYDTLSGKPFPRIVYINSANYYQMYYLTYFPVPYIEYPGTQASITYVKLKGREYGKKE